MILHTLSIFHIRFTYHPTIFTIVVLSHNMFNQNTEICFNQCFFFSIIVIWLLICSRGNLLSYENSIPFFGRKYYCHRLKIYCKNDNSLSVFCVLSFEILSHTGSFFLLFTGNISRYIYIVGKDY